jgi:hypothetical protein
MSDHLPYDRSISYCKGFVDGYEEGVDNNPYDGDSEAVNNSLYKIGYDAGVAEYCRENLDSEESE